jgi:hypothetical protein
MKSKITAVLFVVTLSGCAALEPRPWSQQDIMLEAATITVLALDRGQTHRISSAPPETPGTYRYETNPILGKHPSTGQINIYFAAVALLHIYIVDQLPPKWRPYFQIGTIAVEAAVIHDNYQQGLNIRF